MKKVLFSLGFIEIKWYSFFMFIAILTASILVFKEAKKKNIKEELLYDIAFYGIIIGILGARLYYVLFNLDYYLSNPLEIVQIWHGGLAIHGALLSTLVYLIVVTKKKKLNLPLITDICVVGIIIGQAIGRWGNFFNQEAFGRVIELSYLKNLHLPKFIIDGMYINGYYREPTFLYESIFNIIGFIILYILRKSKNIKTGMLTSFYLIWYGAVRFIVESFRTDSLMLGPLKMAQLISIVFTISGIILFIVSNKKNKKYSEDKIQSI